LFSSRHFLSEPCLVLRLSKRVLDQIYYNNKAKLCEIRIRLMGVNVDLLHAIDHPKGGDLFLQYLTRERAAENLTFYRAVDRFDAMCAEIVKQHGVVVKMVERYQEEQNAATAAQQVLLSSGAEVDAVDASGEEGTEKFYPERPNAGGSQYSGASKRLTTINSASNMSDIAGESAKEEGPPKQYSVKIKPGGSSRKSVPAVRQSSFSGRVAVAMIEAEGGALHEETSGEASEADLPSPERLAADSGDIEAAMAVEYAQDGRDGMLDEAVVTDAAEVPADLLGSEERRTQADAGETFQVASADTVPPTVEDATALDAEATPTTPTRRRLHRSSFLKSKHQEQTAPLRSHAYAEGSLKGDVRDPDLRLPSSKNKSSASSKMDRGLKKLNRQIKQMLRSIVELKEVARNIMEKFVYQGSENELNLPGALRVRCERQFNDWNTDLASLLRAQQGSFSLAAPSTDTVEESGDFSSATPTNLARQMSLMSATSNGVSANFRSTAQGGPAASKRPMSVSTLVTSADSTDTAAGPRGHNPDLSPSYQSFAVRESAINGMPVFFGAGPPVNASAADAAVVDACGTSQEGKAACSPNSSAQLTGSAEVKIIPIESSDISFVDLFKEAKQEILKLLRDDKFPRWKATKEFHNFIAGIRPYDEVSRAARRQSQGVDNSFFASSLQSLESAGL
jgi:hypothetical protein